jgi:NADPH-dependent ferric siderophore reductase
VEVRWLHAVGDDAFLAAVTSCDADRAWVACEAMLMRRVRSALLESGRFTTASLATRGYWRRGEANHPDHDTGDDAG